MKTKLNLLRLLKKICLAAFAVNLFLVPFSLIAEPASVKPSVENIPTYESLPYVITDIRHINKIGKHTEKYSVILQTKDIPDTSAILRTAQHLWDHRLPRATEELEIAVYLPDMKIEHMPIIAIHINTKGVQTLTYQTWVLKPESHDTRFGLSTRARRHIFNLMVLAEQEADNSDLRSELLWDIRGQYHISDKELRGIAFEGMMKQWVTTF